MQGDISARHKGSIEPTVTVLGFPGVTLPSCPVFLLDVWHVVFLIFTLTDGMTMPRPTLELPSALDDRLWEVTQS